MSDPIVKVEQGQLRGKIDKNYDGGCYYTFHNIPYAKPPIGELRFKAPQPSESWKDIRDATQEGDECFQIHLVTGKPVGSENCLTLNVYTPQLPTNYNNLKPVMVWIHGGAYLAGSSKTEVYDPQFLICEDVVIVSINYRTGVLGFLSLEDPALGVPGNAGLKDQVLALKWVKNNIREFNGDPNNITIFGESAGGASVHYLVLSPMAKGLFHRAIMQSGCALNDVWARGTRCAIELAGHLGCDAETEKDALEFLRKARKEDILKAQFMCRDHLCVNYIRPHGPIVEKFNSFEEAFLPDEPINIISSGNYNKVPIMIGYTSREGMLMDIYEKRLNIKIDINDYEKFVPYFLKMPTGSPMSKNVAEKIKKFYYGNEDPCGKKNDSYYKLQSDNCFFRGIYSSVRNHLENLHEPIYYYRFSFEGTLNVYKNLYNITNKGVCHFDEIGYLFNVKLNPAVNPGSIEEITIRRFTKLWTNFAKTGNPNPAKKDDLIPVEWPTAKPNNLIFLDIGENLTIGCNPDIERMRFWDEIFALNPATSKY